MNKFCILSLAVLFAATAGAGEDFDGSRPMECKPIQTHDCLPTEKMCTPLKPEAGKDETLHVDVAKMSVKTPFRTDTLPIASYEFNTESLVMQGTSLELIDTAAMLPMIIFMDPPHHDRQRKLVSRAFTPRAISDLEPFVRATAARFLDTLVEQGGGDFVEEFSAVLPMTVLID